MAPGQQQCEKSEAPGCGPALSAPRLTSLGAVSPTSSAHRPPSDSALQFARCIRAGNASFFFCLVPGQVVQGGFQNRPASYPPPPAPPARAPRPQAQGRGSPGRPPPLLSEAAEGRLGAPGTLRRPLLLAWRALIPRQRRPCSVSSGTGLPRQPAGPGYLDWRVRPRPLPPTASQTWTRELVGVVMRELPCSGLRRWALLWPQGG